MIIDLDRIRARHNAWYNDEAPNFPGWPEGREATLRERLDALSQSLNEKVMAFEIVREDVPALIAEVERLHASRAMIQTQRTRHLREAEALRMDLESTRSRLDDAEHERDDALAELKKERQYTFLAATHDPEEDKWPPQRT